MPIIRFEQACVRFGEFTALEPTTLELKEQRIAIIGENGGGKSTLVRLINGLGSPTSGQVSVDGLDVAKHAKQVRKEVGFVFSDPENQIVMPTVADDIAFSLRRFKLPAEQRKQRVADILHRFGLEQQQEQSPHVLSGGQKHLLALAAVLVINPKLIVADEPTTLLDLRNRDRLRQIFSTLEQQLIVVTHDLEFVEDFDRAICLHDHRVAFDGPPREVIAEYKKLVGHE
ncbi:energy-coupling factor ABC transporter ATP-binding protein [Corynebacterium pelargi]|uniref:Biotin transport ATP-binding protein BioM n=1 Tax=Corynebacterium pelargi TaxID=1471400 RepID=A0A410W6R1_9CORY|nr:ABC transporter ATP-binding protein [Corynebacterium pelargi]QAU51652.1 Biotin transport ATP-binding protein BioM [Corynebacterium pelargi]GGG80279.1 ABC transporter ATPase [Corynebacterium pelargi]